MPTILLWYDFPVLNFIATSSCPSRLYFWCVEKGNGWAFLSRPARSPEVPCLWHAAWNMYVQKKFPCFELSVMLRGYFVWFARKFAGNSIVELPVGSKFFFDWISSIVLHCRWDWRHFYVCDICSVSVANNFVHLQSATEYGYYAFGEVAHFVYCPLQKINQSSDLPLFEQWEQCMTPNDSKFAAIEEYRFLADTRMISALKKVGNSFLKKEFRRDCRKILEDFVNCVFSTVTARSVIGQGWVVFALLYWWVETIMPPSLSCCWMDC